MNRIDELFNRKKERILSIYMTAGFPELDDTVEVLTSLEREGVDMVEIGIPFSDPLADGVVIQQSSHTALENGMNLRLLFSQLKGIREKVSVPLILMGYLNPILQFGFSKFLETAVDVGIDGLIIPDLPLDLYVSEYKHEVEKSGLKFIMLITPQTSVKRINKIVNASGGFLYMVADSSTTGKREEISKSQVEYFDRINSMNLNIPRLIGFGISDAATFSQASKYAYGAIIGSAFIHYLQENPGIKISENVKSFIGSVLSRDQKGESRKAKVERRK